MSESLSHELAQWAVDLRPDNLSQSALHASRRAYMDWMASALAGSRCEPAMIMQRLLQRNGGYEQASVFPDFQRYPAPFAALANGVASHILEMDDLHRPSTFHPAAPIIPAALAVAEREKTSGVDFITAVAAAYEIAIRIGEAVNPAHYRYWHPTATVGTFGAAVAAAKLLRLDARKMAQALGNAGTLAAGLWEFNTDGAMSKHLHPGHAAMTGVMVADMAKEGFTGAGRILEGERGFFQAMAGTYTEEAVLKGLPRPARLRIEDNTFKCYPCCGHTHPGADLALEWSSQLSGERIACVQVYTYKAGMDIVANPAPETPYQAKFSYPFVLAWALTHGSLNVDSFEPEAIHDQAVRALMSKITMHHDPALDALYPESWPVRVVVETESGHCWENKREHPRGSPQNPVSDEELRQKAASLVGEEVADQMAEHVSRLWRSQHVNLSELAQAGMITSAVSGGT